MKDMDEVDANKAFVAYRVKEIFDLPTQASERPRTTSNLVLRRQRQRFRVRVENRCRKHFNEGRAFIGDRLKDVIYFNDLVNGLGLSLDLGGRLGSGDEKCLVKYVRLLDDLMPKQNPKLTLYLRYLSRYLSSSMGRRRFRPRDFIEAEEAFRDELRPFNDTSTWLGCSENGFSCALWQLFHYLTVEAANRKSTSINALDAVLCYVRSFYAASSKSLFLRHLREEMPSRLNDLEADALWLWKAHNAVNLGLYDASRSRLTRLRRPPKDPSSEFCKKERFPGEAVCPRCYFDSGEFDSDEVIMQYLYEVYAKDKIIM